MQMLEETKRHFVICQSAHIDPDPRLAIEPSPSIDSSGETSNQLKAAFLEQQAAWLHDLNALAVCTGDEHWLQ